MADNRCLSYNLIPILGMDVLICELSDSYRFVGYQNFTSEVGGIYRGLEVKVDEELISFLKLNMSSAKNPSCLNKPNLILPKVLFKR